MKRRVGQYLMDAVHEARVNKIFGVPGDFNLAFLDDIVSHEGVEWVGTTNELNGAYTADGYARMNGLGVLVTTFGVGELSALMVLQALMQNVFRSLLSQAHQPELLKRQANMCITL